MAAKSALVFVAALCLAQSAFGCVFEYGTTKEAAAIAGAEYNYAYNGLTWMNKFEGCRGQKQSPILLPATGAAAESLAKPAAKSTFSYGTIKDAVIVNNGHGMQVSLPKDFKSDVKIPVLGAAKTATATSVVNGKGDVTYVKATPAQFHFHTTSEHVMSGAVFAMEMHIVHFIQPDQLPACGEVKGFPGCPVVLGIMIALTNDESEVHPELKRLVEAMPLQEGQKNTISGDLDVGSLLPKNMAYMQYEGSLTTPPCSEGLLWHVLTTPIKISQKLLTKYQEAVGDLYCSNDKENDNKRIVPHEKPDANGTYFQLPRSNADGCYKLANGHNYRAIQPLNGRVIKMAT